MTSGTSKMTSTSVIASPMRLSVTRRTRATNLDVQLAVDKPVPEYRDEDKAQSTMEGVGSKAKGR